MTPIQALKLIGSALEVASSKGAFTLKDSAVIFNALQILNKSNITTKPETKPMDETKTEASVEETAPAAEATETQAEQAAE